MVRCLWLVFGLLPWLVPGTAAAQFQYVQYRGMPAGWPNQQAANYTAYYAPQYGQPMYYVARPTTAAYANPAYFGGYNVATTQRPMTAAYYAPQGYAPAIYAQPTTAYYGASPAQYGSAAQYAPQAQYAATSAYSVSPAGGSTAGAEAYPYYGQPTAVNYVPPRFAYRTTYAQVPVYMYRPVTAYQPVTGQPVTCLQPATTTQCVPQRTRYHSWFSHSWFSHSWFHGSRSACGAPPPTTAYCAPTYAAPAYAATTCNSGQCGQPYYPTQPGVIIPTVPAQPTVVPGTAPGTIISPVPPAGPTIPSPPTRFGPGASGTIISPADRAPSLAPGTRTVVPPSTTPLGPGSFPVDPSSPGTINPSPATPFNPSPFNPGPSGTGSLGTGTGYAPATDPYSKPNSSPVTQVGPVRGPDLRAATPPATIQEPKSPALAPGVQTVPDPDALQPVRPINRAPQLLDPRDKTAAATQRVAQSAPAGTLRGDRRWAVVPAVWPQPQPAALAAPANSPYRAYEERSYSPPAARAATPATSASAYDDSGWASDR